MKVAIGVGVAGAVGALARYGLDGIVARRTGAASPWGTFVVNLTGAFLVGVLFTMLTERMAVAPWIRSSVLIGLLGGYTTFSTLSLETYRLIEDGAYLLAAANGLGSLAGGLVATGRGHRHPRHRGVRGGLTPAHVSDPPPVGRPARGDRTRRHRGERRSGPAHARRDGHRGD